LSSFTPFAIDALRCEPWRNGAGWTRTICAQHVPQASAPASAQAGNTAEAPVLWRVSVADITAAGQFSQFEGMDRTAVMVQGGRLQLSNAAVQLNFDGIGSQLQFPGEWSLHCSEPEGTTQLLNIMVRRGQASARVQVLKGTTLTLTPGGQQVALVLRGSYQLQSTGGKRHTLQARTGMHWQAHQENWRAEPLGADAVLVWCTLTC
jgi:environmental stress-induced protein Ves